MCRSRGSLGKTKIKVELNARIDKHVLYSYPCHHARLFYDSLRDEEVDLLAEFYHLVSIHLPFVLSAPCFFGWTSHIFGCIRSPSTENELFQDTDTYIEKKYENTKGPLMS